MQKQSRIPGADLATVSALLRQLAPEAEQQMAFVNEPSGRICSWGIPLAECWGCVCRAIAQTRCPLRCS